MPFGMFQKDFDAHGSAQGLARSSSPSVPATRHPLHSLPSDDLLGQAACFCRDKHLADMSGLTAEGLLRHGKRIYVDKVKMHQLHFPNPANSAP
jgi:hypothetical protein